MILYLFLAADESFAQRRFGTAIELYSVVIEHNNVRKQCINVLSNRAACYLQNKSYDLCLQDSNEAMRLIREEDEVVGEPAGTEEKVTPFNRLYKLKNYVRKASAYCELGNVDEALQCYNEAVLIVNSLEEEMLKPLMPLVMDMEKVKHLCRYTRFRLICPVIRERVEDARTNAPSKISESRASPA